MTTIKAMALVFNIILCIISLPNINDDAETTKGKMMLIVFIIFNTVSIMM